MAKDTDKVGKRRDKANMLKRPKVQHTQTKDKWERFSAHGRLILWLNNEGFFLEYTNECLGGSGISDRIGQFGRRAPFGSKGTAIWTWGDSIWARSGRF